MINCISYTFIFFCYFSVCYNVNYWKTYQQVVALFNKYTPITHSANGTELLARVRPHSNMSEYWIVMWKTRVPVPVVLLIGLIALQK